MLSVRDARASGQLGRQAFLAVRRTGCTQGVSGLLAVTASCAVGRESWTTAARLHGATSRALAADPDLSAVGVIDEEQEMLDSERARVRSQLGDSDYGAAFAADAALPARAAIELALGRTA